MTVTQANAIMKMLPLGYTLQIDRESKNKRQNNRKKNSAKKETLNPDEPPPERLKKNSSSVKYNDDAQVLANYSRVNSQQFYEDIEDNMKPCLKILQMLKSSKTSWPFR